ncbi:MAG: tRNA (N(6)-L-threonylcarbamoyladenosine(37)-C(2))-methylthiotransferase MtaB [Elusimicrobia bacterium]|nr:tRNA (N(6)-L-threonylcarbamoyladenosine(37)-C(2))-methylthiotransferase MtaB [Elusimicrobiota bacterium]
MRVYVKTFGCRVNQAEGESLKERLLSDGFSTAVPDFESADLAVVNTCTVTVEGDQDALRLVRRIARRNPAARLVVTGCLATRSPDTVRAAAPEALIVGNDRKEDIPALLGCRPVPDEAGLRAFAGRARAFLKVQDGCDMSCTYCIIPSVRPEMSSKPASAVLAEARDLVARGYRELVLCGIRLGRFLSEDGGRRVDFVGLLERLCALEGDFRVRLSSFEVTDVTERFLDAAEAAGPRLCPSFHLPLQSGSEAVLRRMNRWYSAAFFGRRVESLRRRFPDAGLFTDLMTGFPAETEAEHAQSRAFVETLGFSGLHVFRFSARAGTPAARRRDHLPEAAVVARAEEFRALDADLRAAFARRHVGRERRVLVETRGRGAQGLTEHFLRVRFEEDPGPGMVRARLTGAEGAWGLAAPCAVAGLSGERI